jgi:hypothetical protein
MDFVIYFVVCALNVSNGDCARDPEKVFPRHPTYATDAACKQEVVELVQFMDGNVQLPEGYRLLIRCEANEAKAS